LSDFHGYVNYLCLFMCQDLLCMLAVAKRWVGWLCLFVCLHSKSINTKLDRHTVYGIQSAYIDAVVKQGVRCTSIGLLRFTCVIAVEWGYSRSPKRRFLQTIGACVAWMLFLSPSQQANLGRSGVWMFNNRNVKICSGLISYNVLVFCFVKTVL